MNNKGQSLITFVLILPLIVMFIAFFIDSSLSIIEKNKLDGIVYDNMKVALNKEIRDIDKITSSIKKNIDANIMVIIDNDELIVHASSKKKSIFGKLLKFPYYNLKLNYCGNYIDKKIDKNCEK